MEKMPYQPDVHDALIPASLPVTTDWRAGLPLLTGSRITLRELRLSDTPSLFALLTSGEVTRFISPPPTTLDGFERFVAWTHRQREAGQNVCFAVVPFGCDTAVGLFQVRALDLQFDTAEWGFALGREYWGTGMFVEGARLVLDFAFLVIGAHRVEARAAMRNGRGNGALRKIGASQEGVLRASFLRNGEYLDQMLWSILYDDWRDARLGLSQDVIH